MSKENKELEAKILELEAKIKNLKNKKKYGLVWEEKPEEVVEFCKTNIPVLREIRGKEVLTDESKPINILIEGDNYYSLSVLNYTHKNKVDLIYIDPPYNTGAKNWRYNNDYVDGDDEWRHSKWISYMNRRLVLARELLKDRGILVCAIDKNEHANLGLLLKQTFPNYSIDCVTVVHNPRGIQGKNFSYNHEYIYFVYPDDGNKYILDADRETILERNFRVDGGNSPRSTTKTMFYPIIIRKDKIIGFGDIADSKYHPKEQTQLIKGDYYIWPIDINGIERKWSFSRNTVEEIKDELIFKKRGTRYEIYRQKNASPYRTVWTGPKYDANEYGSKLVNSIIDTNFPFPKSLYNVLECLYATVRDNKDAVILDFFAGSGTTGHAVFELNKQDKGNRQFILCTNNENNICEEVTYERIKRIIKGYKNTDNQKIEGFGGNLKYYKTTLIPKSFNRDEMKIRITEECTEMLCIREGIYEEVKNKSAYKIFKQGDKILAIYYFLSQKELSNLKKDLDKMNGEKILYCFTLDSLGLGESDFDNWMNVRLESIPQKILDIYKEINEY